VKKTAANACWRGWPVVKLVAPVALADVLQTSDKPEVRGQVGAVTWWESTRD